MLSELRLIHDTKGKSFYKKAMVEVLENSIKLFSFNTLVAEITIDENKMKVFDVPMVFSNTTLRHLKEFYYQYVEDAKEEISIKELREMLDK